MVKSDKDEGNFCKISAQEKKRERKKQQMSLCQRPGNKTQGDKSIIISINFENTKDSVWPIIIQEILPEYFVSYIYIYIRAPVQLGLKPVVLKECVVY